jgi:hypothetical protein
MSLKLFVGFILVCLTGTQAFAHKIGNSKWCLMYTASHWECVYDDVLACEATLKQVQFFVQKNPSQSLVPNEKSEKKWDPFCSSNPDPTSKGFF